jgi:surfeit locus 1 family protein
MRPAFRFSRIATLIGVIGVLLSLRASHWQYTRHQDKLRYIQTMSSRLDSPVRELTELLATVPPESAELPYRRVTVAGTFDFAHEVILKNRRLQGFPGVHVLTPLKLTGSDHTVLVSRGFIPLSRSKRDMRAQYHGDLNFTGTALIKEGSSAHLLAPQDPPTGQGLPWVDEWLRVDLSRIQAQLPYTLLPFYLEIMETPTRKGIEEQIVMDKSGREDVFFIADKNKKIRSDSEIPDVVYPLPVFDTVIPPGRHQSYIYEWLFIALLFGAGSLIWQLRRPRTKDV